MKKRMILFLFTTILVIFGGLYVIKGEASYAHVLMLTTRIMNTDQPQAFTAEHKPHGVTAKNYIYITANIPDGPDTLSNHSLRPDRNNLLIRRCMHATKGILYTQFDCPEGYRLLSATSHNKGFIVRTLEFARNRHRPKPI